MPNERPNGHPRDLFKSNFPFRLFVSFLKAVEELMAREYLQFSHYSVKEYLTSSRILTTTFSNFRIEQPVAHQMLAKISLIYLLTFQAPFSQISEFSVPFFFLPYARTEWYRHLVAATIDESHTPERDLVIRLFEPASVPYLNLLGDLYAIADGPHEILQSSQATHINGALWISSYLGLHDVVESLLLRGAEITVRDGQHWTCYPLLAAVHRGHGSVIRLLLKHGANVNCPAVWVGYPLHVASREGRLSVVKLLLNEGAHVNDLAPETRQNALHEAALNGHVEVARLLLEYGANIDEIGGRCGTPLQAAAQCGSEAMVRLLLENDADTNIEGGGYYSPLMAATLKGDETIVRLLLDHAANVYGKGELGTVLHQAVQKGDTGIASIFKHEQGEQGIADIVD
jgi:ankyrin repeat protein